MVLEQVLKLSAENSEILAGFQTEQLLLLRALIQVLLLLLYPLGFILSSFIDV